ncbi:hypothetical protein [uncultured Xanthomonas sp.]|uniref:hypothetical protein n=1 Tax=uncultured Xanthomonas sp. TaxID=152831 RepID=UPI0025F4C6A3|nr:hypothetical protein [uncultured Xanthomonas sp.]
MATCVTLNADGTLTQTGQSADQCSGYVLVSSAEHAQAQILVDIFAWPQPEVAHNWFMAAFYVVLALNVVGYVVGAVVKAVSTERD